MVSAKLAAVLVAAVVLQAAVAFPAESLEKDKCTALVFKFVGIMERLTRLIDEYPDLASSTEVALNACQHAGSAEEVAECEKEVKVKTGIKALKMLKGQVALGKAGQVVLTSLLSACRSQNPLLLEHQLLDLLADQVARRDVPRCFQVVVEIRVTLEEMEKRIQESAKVAIDTVDRILECSETPGDPQCFSDAILASLDDLLAALADNLAWEDGARDDLTKLYQCMSGVSAQ